MKNLMLVLTVLLAAVCRADYVDEVMADGPEAYYRFEEPVGETRVADSSGNGYDGSTSSSKVMGFKGRVGSAGFFSGDDYVLTGLTNSVDAGNFSIEALAWFDATDDDRIIVSQQDGTGTGRSLFYRSGGGYLRTYLGGDTRSSDDPVGQSKWHHLVMTVEDGGESDTIRFYIDGQPAGVRYETAEFADGQWLLGSSKRFLSTKLIGFLDEVAIYTNLLSEARIQAHVNALPALRYLHVSLSGTSASPYTNWTTAATNIQDAVNVASAGDIVLVTNGTYYVGEAGSVVLPARVDIRKNILVKSVNGYTETMINGGGPQGDSAVRCAFLSDGATLSGFMLLNGYTRGSEVGDILAKSGGGACLMGEATLENCCFIFNSAALDGGAVYCAQDGIIRNCTFQGNTAGNKGGAVAGGSYTGTGKIMNCIFKENSTPKVEGSGGGAVYLGYYGTWTVEDCTFEENVSDYGGALFSFGPAKTIRRCTFLKNTARRSGGGLYLNDGGLVENCLVVSNRSTWYQLGCAGGMFVSGPATVRHCTITANSTSLGDGGGVYCNGGDMEIQNCIIMGNVSTEYPNWYSSSSTPNYVNNCTVPAVGSGCITNDPHFEEGSLYRLLADSPCIDAGINLSGAVEDFDRNGRPLDGDVDGIGIADIGAYEFYNPAGDSDGDGLIDDFEINTLGTSILSANTDGDSQSDYEEYIAGTDGKNGKDSFCINALANGTVFFQSLETRSYTLLTCTNLLEGVWVSVTNRMGIGGQDSMSGTNDAPQAYYKVQVELP